MHSSALRLLALLLVCGLAACQSPPSSVPARGAKAAASGKKADLAVRNNAFALLLELFNEEKHLSKLLLIKRESAELDRLVTAISKTSSRGAALLESIAKRDTALAQARPDLPPGEQATRAAIAKSKKHQLLNTKGLEFEVALLFTQVEALNYGAHLASVLAENESDPARAQQLSQLSTELKELHDRVLTMLRKK